MGIDCNADAPDIDFIIGGKKYTLTKADYTLPAGGGKCLFAFLGMDIPAPAGLLVFFVTMRLQRVSCSASPLQFFQLANSLPSDNICLTGRTSRPRQQLGALG